MHRTTLVVGENIQVSQIAKLTEQIAQEAPVPTRQPVAEHLVELPEGLGCVDQNVLGDLRRGAIDQLPESALECLSPDVRARIPDELIDFASTNPYITIGAVTVALLATGLCLFKLAKKAVFMALLLGAVAGVGWWVGFGSAF